MTHERGSEQSPTFRMPRGSSLCAHCKNVRTITSAKGSVFYLCELSLTDPRYAKYPPQPVVACPGFTR